MDRHEERTDSRARIQPLAGERRKGESLRAVQACNDYLRLGPRRTLSALTSPETNCDCVRPPTALGTLKRWSTRYGWQARAEAYDARLEAEKNARAREIMETGLALAHERVAALKELAAVLRGELYATDEQGRYRNLWLHDVKVVGAGADAEQVDLWRFNSALVEQYRKTLDDLAQETGGRIHKADVKVGGGVNFTPEDVAEADRLLREFREQMAQQEG